MDNFYEELSDQAQDNIAMLNSDQRKLFYLVAQSVENNNGDIFALDAPGRIKLAILGIPTGKMLFDLGMEAILEKKCIKRSKHM